jgi:hypothetical protein
VPGPAERRTSPPLGVLAERLREARARVGEHRTGAAGSSEALDARHSVLAALDDFITALEARGIPVPYLLRDELRLHRVLFGSEQPTESRTSG